MARSDDVTDLAKHVLSRAAYEKNRDDYMWFNHPDVPRDVYHGSGFTFPSFHPNKVAMDQLGFHFGNVPQATEFAVNPGLNQLGEPHAKLGQEGRQPNIWKMHLSLRNPIRLKDNGDWSRDAILPQLLQKGLIRNQETVDKIGAQIDGMSSHQEQNLHLRKILRHFGHDGVIYLNRVEGIAPMDRMKMAKIPRNIMKNMSDEDFKANFPSAADSFITFGPSQMKSATGNNGMFSPYENDPTKAEGGAIDDQFEGNHPEVPSEVYHQQHEVGEGQLGLHFHTNNEQANDFNTELRRNYQSMMLKRDQFIDDNHHEVPDKVYHGTMHDVPQFDTETVKSDQLGFHVGSNPRQANEFTQGDVYGDWREGRTPNVIPLHVSLKRPLRLIDKGTWSPEDVLPQVADSGRISHQQAQDLIEHLENFDTDEREHEHREVLKKLGYDGVIYLNRREGLSQRDQITSSQHDAHYAEEDEDGNYLPGTRLHDISDEEFQDYYPSAKDSYILFDPPQLKSALSSGFDPAHPKLTKAGGGGVGTEMPDTVYHAQHDVGPGQLGWHAHSSTGQANDFIENLRRNYSTQLVKRDQFISGNHPIVPNVLYHGTMDDIPAFDLSKIREDQLGFHLGNPAAANEFAKPKKFPDKQPNLIPVHVTMKNPVRLKDEGSWSSGNVLWQLRQQGKLSPDDTGRLIMKLNKQWMTPEEKVGRLQDIFRAVGHDGAYYLNRFEGMDTKDQRKLQQMNGASNLTDEEFKKEFPSSDFSFIAFHPNHIKSALSSGYDQLRPELTRSTGGRLELARKVMGRKWAEGMPPHPSKFMPGVPRAVHADGGKVNFDEILERARQRKALAARLAADGKPVRLVHPSGRTAIAGPDMSKPGGYRVTFFDEHGPSNHVEHDTLEKAVDMGLQEKFTPVDGRADGGTVISVNGKKLPRPKESYQESKYVPQKTVKAYKLFRRGEDGGFYPLYVDAHKEVPVGKWLDAEEGPPGKRPNSVSSKLNDLAFRPGWHAGDLPMATHIGETDGKDPKPKYRRPDEFWGEVEMPDDYDWQSVANSRGKGRTAHITDQIPHGGHYRYKTNSNMTGDWLIGGQMRLNRILGDDEVKTINDAAGTADLPRKPVTGDDNFYSKALKVLPKKAGGGETSLAKQILAGPSFRPEDVQAMHDKGFGARGMMSSIPLSEGRISQRFPTSKKAEEDPLKQNLLINMDVMRSQPSKIKQASNLVASYPNMTNSMLEMHPEERLMALQGQMQRNLLHMWDLMGPEGQERAAKWYLGANRIINERAEEIGLHPHGVAGAYAALSPQKDWFQNVYLGDQVLRIIGMDPKMNDEMLQKAGSIKSYRERPKYMAALRRVMGKNLSDMDPREQALVLRLHDETYGPRQYHKISPEGDYGAISLTGKRKPQKPAWGSFNEIEKSIMSARAGDDMSLISPLMGNKHKVRNFFNNIVAPIFGEKFGDITADTHQIAASLFRPLSGKTAEVAHGLGSSPPKGMTGAPASAMTGMQGLYPLFADATRGAAAERGVPVRAMQSVPWEGIRSLFPKAFKTAINMEKVDNIWRAHARGDISEDKAREHIIALAGGFRPPTW